MCNVSLNVKPVSRNAPNSVNKWCGALIFIMLFPWPFCSTSYEEVNIQCYHKHREAIKRKPFFKKKPIQFLYNFHFGERRDIARIWNDSISILALHSLIWYKIAAGPNSYNWKTCEERINSQYLSLLNFNAQLEPNIFQTSIYYPLRLAHLICCVPLKLNREGKIK